MDASKAPEKEGRCRRRSACCSSSTLKQAASGSGARREFPKIRGSLFLGVLIIRILLKRVRY